MYIFYFMMLLIITPWVYVKGMPYNYGIYYYPKELYMTLLTFVIFIYLIYKHKKRELKIDKIYMSLFLILFAIFTIGHRYSGTPLFSGRTIGGFFIFVITFIYFYNFAKKKLTIYIVGLAALIESFIVITQRLGGYYSFTGIESAKGRLLLAGTMGNVNMLSHFLSAAFLIVGYYIFIEKNRVIRISMVVGNSFIFYTILSTQTRGSILAVLIGILILVTKYYTKIILKNKKISLHCIVGILIAILCFMAVDFKIDKLKERIGTTEGVNSTVERILIWKETIELIKEKPLLGHGTGSFIIEEQKIFNNLTKEKGYIEFKNKNAIAAHSHNDYLQTFAENGIIAFIIIITIIIVTIIKFAKSKKYSSGIFFAGALSYMITALFEFPFHMIHNGVIAFAILGIFASISSSKNRI